MRKAGPGLVVVFIVEAAISSAHRQIWCCWHAADKTGWTNGLCSKIELHMIRPFRSMHMKHFWRLRTAIEMVYSDDLCRSCRPFQRGFWGSKGSSYASIERSVSYEALDVSRTYLFSPFCQQHASSIKSGDALRRWQFRQWRRPLDPKPALCIR